MTSQHRLLPRCLPIVQRTLQDIQHSCLSYHSVCESSLALAPARSCSARCGSARAAVAATIDLADRAPAAGQHQRQDQWCKISFTHRCSRSASPWDHFKACRSQQCAHTAAAWPQLHGTNQFCMASVNGHQRQLHQKACAGAAEIVCVAQQQQQQLLQLHQGRFQHLSNRQHHACNIDSPLMQRHGVVLLCGSKHPTKGLPSQLQLFTLPWRLQQQHCFHGKQQQQSIASQTAEAATAAGARPRRVQVPGASWTSLPNLLSLSRVASGPCVAYLIATQQWPLAVLLTVTAGATDWLDGYLARRLGHTSKLGSYLDPLADKVLIGSVVGTMGVLGMVPAWLAVLVVGRDAAQVTGMAWYRLNMFGGKWPGAAAFFDVDGSATAAATAPREDSADRASSVCDCRSSSNSSSKTDADHVGTAAAAAGGDGLPAIQPLMVSKVNTALVFVLVAGCMTQQWQGMPGQEVLQALEVAIAGTSAASGAAYGWLYYTGRLLPGSKQ